MIDSNPDVGGVEQVDAGVEGLPDELVGSTLVDVAPGAEVHGAEAEHGDGQAGGDNIIALFGQWGAIQLLLAAVLWVLLLRYRGLTPFVYLIFIVEPVLRAASGFLKPVEAIGIGPGHALNWLAVPILAVLLLFSLSARKPRTT